MFYTHMTLFIYIIRIFIIRYHFFNAFNRIQKIQNKINKNECIKNNLCYLDHQTIIFHYPFLPSGLFFNK